MQPLSVLLFLQPCDGADPQKGQKRNYQVGRLTLRTLFFDDQVLSAVKAGASQVVILGAGMDCRAWRLDLPAGEDHGGLGVVG